MDFKSSSTLAYQITSFMGHPATSHCYFIFDENIAALIENKIVSKHWKVLKIHYDSSGGEIVTNEGDIIYLSKEILIKKTIGEEIILEYEPIDIDEIIFEVRNL